MRAREADAVRLPEENGDLKQYVLRKFQKALIKTLIWEIFWLFTFVFYYKRGEVRLGLRFCIVAGGLFLLGIVLFGIYKWWFDHNYRAVITRIQCREVIKCSALGRTRRVVTVMRLRLLEENGRRHALDIPYRKMYDRYYVVGDTVRHYRGLPYPESEAASAKNLVLCLRCGGTEQEGVDLCRGCGASIVRFNKNRYAKDI